MLQFGIKIVLVLVLPKRIRWNFFLHLSIWRSGNISFVVSPQWKWYNVQAPTASFEFKSMCLHLNRIVHTKQNIVPSTRNGMKRDDGTSGSQSFFLIQSIEPAATRFIMSNPFIDEYSNDEIDATSSVPTIMLIVHYNRPECTSLRSDVRALIVVGFSCDACKTYISGQRAYSMWIFSYSYVFGSTLLLVVARTVLQRNVERIEFSSSSLFPCDFAQFNFIGTQTDLHFMPSIWWSGLQWNQQ